jgi:SAM-dependent methyltransferase
MSVIEETLPDWRKLAIHESSPATRGASVKLAREGLNYTPTQFFPGATPGTVIDGFRNEDLEAQTFGDSTLDLVVTLDVFEHVYDPAAAFREIARTLRPGGMHIFTTPLVNQHEPSEVWATRNPDGTPNFLHEPEWHGNPVDAQGSPVTMHWGFDIVDFIEQACGMETHIVRKYDLRRGLWAELNEVIVSKKS